MKPRVYLIIFALTFIVAFSPLFIGNTGAYYTVAVDTIEVNISVDGQTTQEQTIVEGLTTASGRSTTEEQIIIEEQPPLAEPNTQRVDDGVFWIVLAFAMLLFSVFVFMSYQRKMESEADPGVPDDEDEGIPMK